MWRIFYSSQPLHGARVRQAKRADDSVRPWLRSRPLNRVVAVAAFVAVCIEFTFAGVASTHVLNHDGVASHGGLVEGSPLFGSVVLAIRRAIDENWEFSAGGRKHNVGSENHSIAHHRFHVLLDDWCGLRVWN